jgi:hypothetical protein
MFPAGLVTLCWHSFGTLLPFLFYQIFIDTKGRKQGRLPLREDYSLKTLEIAKDE